MNMEYNASVLLFYAFFDVKEGVFTVNISSCIQEILIIIHFKKLLPCHILYKTAFNKIIVLSIVCMIQKSYSVNFLRV
jgi:hypothetical protein